MKKLFAIAMTLCLLAAAMTALADVAADNEAAWYTLPYDENAEEGVMMSYTAILEEYADVLNDAADLQIMEDMRQDPEFSDLVFAVDSGRYGYALKDLDGDGNLELIIGTVDSDDLLYGRMILLLATNDGREADILFVSTAEDSYYYAGGASFAYLHSGTDAVDTTYVLENGELKDQQQVTAVEQYVQMELELLTAADEE